MVLRFVLPVVALGALSFRCSSASAAEADSKLALVTPAKRKLPVAPKPAAASVKPAVKPAEPAAPSVKPAEDARRELADDGTMGQVTGANVNVRSGPGTDSSIVVTLRGGEYVKARATRGAWLEIDWPGSVGTWIPKDAVQMPAANTVATLKTSTVVRAKPDRAGASVASLASGASVTVLGESGAWLRIKAPQAARAFISAKYVVTGVQPATKSRKTDNVVATAPVKEDAPAKAVVSAVKTDAPVATPVEVREAVPPAVVAADPAAPSADTTHAIKKELEGNIEDIRSKLGPITKTEPEASVDSVETAPVKPSKKISQSTQAERLIAESQRKAAEESARLEAAAKKQAEEEQARLLAESQRKAAEESARLEAAAKKQAEEEQARLLAESQRKAAEETARATAASKSVEDEVQPMFLKPGVAAPAAKPAAEEAPKSASRLPEPQRAASIRIDETAPAKTHAAEPVVVEVSHVQAPVAARPVDLRSDETTATDKQVRRKFVIPASEPSRPGQRAEVITLTDEESRALEGAPMPAQAAPAQADDPDELPKPTGYAPSSHRLGGQAQSLVASTDADRMITADGLLEYASNAPVTGVAFSLNSTGGRYFLAGAEGVDLAGFAGRRVSVSGKPLNTSVGGDVALLVSSIFPRD
jgi:uncharacterized protein YgiM (DUF1202 family)